MVTKKNSNSTQTNIPKTNMKKTLSLWNFFTIGFGAIIGTGWVLLVGDWMIIGGGPIAAMIAVSIGALFLKKSMECKHWFFLIFLRIRNLNFLEWWLKKALELSI